MMNETFEDINQTPLETIVIQAKERAPLLTNIILAVELIFNRTFSISKLHLVNIKLVTIFVIFYKMAY